MNITVYLGANAGNDSALAEAVRELGSWIGANGHRLVYGGSRSGLMGQLAQSALDAGGTVTGVEPQFFVQQELQHDGLTELIVTKDMTERKTKMIELGDAFIAFPGGTGTLEEIAEVMSKVSLGQLDAPCILYERLLRQPESTACQNDRERPFHAAAPAGYPICGESGRDHNNFK
mgnify:CR=1 FL=1